MNWWEELRLSWEEPATWAEQLRDQIRARIQQGRLKPGQRLPSVRELARALNVHFNTVARAYRLLAREGWIRMRPGRGAFVAGTPPETWAQEALQDMARRFVEQALWLGFGEAEIRQALEEALRERVGAS